MTFANSFLHSIESNTVRLQRLVDDLLDLSSVRIRRVASRAAAVQRRARGLVGVGGA